MMSSPEWAQFVRLASDSAAEKERFYFNCVRSKGESIRSFVVDKRCPTLETNVKVHVF